MRRITCWLLLLPLVLTQALSGCARQGLITEQDSPRDYQIERQLTENRIDENAPFMVYGDNRPGWRAKSKFWSKSAWVTWWQLLIPFYQIYLLGNGAVGGINRLRNVPDYGSKEAELVRDAMYLHAQHEGVGFVVNTGDIATDGRYPSNWSHFVKQNRDEVPFVVDFPFLTVIGNHERTTDVAHGQPNYEAATGYPAFYVFETPYMDLFIVDSNLLVDQYDEMDDTALAALFEEWFVSHDPATPAWLERALATSEKPFKAVFMHHPPVAFGEHFADWSTAGYGRSLERRRGELLELLQREGVQIIFCGHQHMYERDRIWLTDGTGIHVVITGGGGAPLHRGFSDAERDDAVKSYARFGLDVHMIVQAEAYNYCIVDVSDTRVVVKAYEVSKKSERNGQLIDEFTIEK